MARKRCTRHLFLLHLITTTGGQGQKSQRGGVNSWGRGVIFSNQRGSPPSTQKIFRLRHSKLLTVPFSIIYLSMNDIPGPLQAKIFINGVLKVLNQAISMILHITILKILPKGIKGGGVESIPEGEGGISTSGGQNIFLRTACLTIWLILSYAYHWNGAAIVQHSEVVAKWLINWLIRY